MTVQSSIIMRLIAQVPDVALQALIRDQYYLDVEANANAAQAAFFDLVGRHEEQLQQQLGATNEMLSEVIAISQHSNAELEALRQTTESGFHSVDHRFAAIDGRIEEIGYEFGSFRVNVDSRFQSVDEKIEAQSTIWRERREQVDAHMAAHNDRITELEQQIAILRDLLTREQGV